MRDFFVALYIQKQKLLFAEPQKKFPDGDRRGAAKLERDQILIPNVNSKLPPASFKRAYVFALSPKRYGKLTSLLIC